MSFRLFGQTITVSSPLRDDEEKAASSIQQKEISFTFMGEPIKVSSPVRDHQEEKEVDDPFNNHAVVIFNPNQNPERKSPVSDEPQRKKIRRETSQPQTEALRDLSPEFRQKIEPALPVFLYRKCLTETDVSRGQNRLLVTEKEKLMQFLTPDEQGVISSEKNSSIEVKAVDCMGTLFTLRLSTWKGSSGGQGEASSSKARKPNKNKTTVVFNQQWCAMLEENGVEPHDIVELWGFRREGKFWLAANFFHP